MEQTIPLSLLKTTAKGAPYHILCATLNAMKLGAGSAKAPEDVFLLSRAYCGSERTGFTPTSQFLRGQYDLASATALSGAALSPAYFHNPLFWTLMLLTNLRLGQWLPNPAHRWPGWIPRPIRSLSQWWWPAPLRRLFEMVGTAWDAMARKSTGTEEVGKQFYCYVTDGGYIENLGVEQLLRRRCRLVIACDVSGDPNYNFSLLMDVIRRVRTEQGIHIHRYHPGAGRGGDRASNPGSDRPEDIGLEDLIPQATRRAQLTTRECDDRFLSNQHLVLARIVYSPRPAAPPPPDRTPPGASEDQGLLIYVKPTLNGDEEVDLLRYWAEHREFPHDPTMDQFYSPEKFESYRHLGFHSGREVLKSLATLNQRDLAALLGPEGRELIEAGLEPSRPSPRIPASKGKGAGRSRAHPPATPEVAGARPARSPVPPTA